MFETIAADELVMSPFSVLGSVDPTTQHPLLPKDSDGRTIPTSVQDLKHCIEFVREQLGESYSKQNLALVVSELFKYINPLALGALEQSYNLARLITRKVLKTHRKPLSKEQIDSIVEALSGQYFSHSFLISRAEVEADLKLSVTKPDEELLELMLKFEDYYVDLFSKSVPYSPSAAEPVVRAGAFIETTDEGWMISQFMSKDNQLLTDPWLKYR